MTVQALESDHPIKERAHIRRPERDRRIHLLLRRLHHHREYLCAHPRVFRQGRTWLSLRPVNDEMLQGSARNWYNRYSVWNLNSQEELAMI
jgi:hypothetical protein